MNDLVILTNCDDWEALFVNGELVDQDHRIRITDLASHCPIRSIVREEMTADVSEYLYERGMFESNLTLDAARQLRPEG